MKTECPECNNVKRHRDGCRYGKLESEARTLAHLCLVLAARYPSFRDDPDTEDIEAWDAVKKQAHDILSNKEITQ